MIRRPPRSTRTDTLFPYTTLFRSLFRQCLVSQGSVQPHFLADTADGWPKLATAITSYPITLWILETSGSIVRISFKSALQNRRIARPAITTGLILLIPLVMTIVDRNKPERSEEHTSELQSLMLHTYAVFCFKKKNKT